MATEIAHETLRQAGRHNAESKRSTGKGKRVYPVWTPGNLEWCLQDSPELIQPDNIAKHNADRTRWQDPVGIVVVRNVSSGA